MKIRPIHDQIVVRRAEAESMSKGGIIIPENAKRKSRHGEVLAVGSGRYLENGTLRPLDIKVGDVVYFRGVNGQEIEIEGEKLVMLREDEVEAIRVEG